MTRNRWALAVALAAALFSGACNRTGKKTIAVIPKGTSQLFWQSVHAGAAKAAGEEHVEMLWNGPPTETDYTGQIQIVDSMINRRVDAICLAPIDKTVMVGVVDRAAQQKVPVIIFDSPVDTRNFVAQIATDNYRAGQMAAERVAAILNGKGTVAEVAVQPGAASSMAREQGFEDTIRKSYPRIRIVDKRYGWADYAKSLDVAENILTAHPDVDALFASNETSTTGAARALKGWQGKKVMLVGFDWGPAMEEGLKTGLIDSVVVQDPFRMGYEAVKTAVQKINGGTPQKIINLAPLVVTRENLNQPDVEARIHPEIEKYLK